MPMDKNPNSKVTIVDVAEKQGFLLGRFRV